MSSNSILVTTTNNYNSLTTTTLTTLSQNVNNAIIYNGSYYLFGSNAVVQSMDATTWSAPTTIANISVINNFAWNNPDYGTAIIKPLTIACGEGNNTLGYSEDGIYWRGLGKDIFTTRANKVIWNGTQWIAVGTGTYWVATSYDGIKWTGRDSTLLTEAYDIAWNGTTLVAVGYGGTCPIVASRDGYTWYGVPASIPIFTTEAATVSWTGVQWIATGSGGNTTAYSTSADAWVWSPTINRNMIVTDVSGARILASIDEKYTSSLMYGYTPNFATDLDINASNTFEWRSQTATYDASSGLNTQLVADTSFNTPSGVQSASGEWLQINYRQPFVAKYYHMAWFLDTSSSLVNVPKEWYILGSQDGDTWTYIDYFNYNTTIAPTNTTAGPFIIKLQNLYTNTSPYLIYRVVIPSIFTNGSLTYTRLGNIEFYVENQNTTTISRYIKPVVTRTHVLYPTSIIQFSESVGQQTVFLATDLNGNVVTNNVVNNGNYTTNIIKGVLNNPITSYCYDGETMIITPMTGDICYSTNISLNTSLNFDISLNGNAITKNITGNVYSSCFNGSRIILGGTGGNVITYSPIFSKNVDNKFTTAINANNLFTSVYCVASNPGYGPMFIENRIYFSPGEKVSIIAPKAYSRNMVSNTALSVSLNNAIMQ